MKAWTMNRAEDQENKGQQSFGNDYSIGLGRLDRRVLGDG